MATKKPLVITNGLIEQLQSGDSIETDTDKVSLTNDQGSAVSIAQAVYVKSDGTYALAQADDVATADVAGLQLDSSVADAASGTIITGGIFTATTGEWDNVTGQTGGLTKGAVYYLSPTTAGALTSTAPTTAGQVVAPIGLALSETQLRIAIDSTVLLSNATGSGGGGSSGRPTGFRSGLTWERSTTDTTNDVIVNPGEARDDGDSDDIVLGSAITKQLDAAWAVGTNAGGLDTGSRANNTWYYIWLIKRSDTGVVDVLLSASVDSPTMPTDYDTKRLIGAIKTEASTLQEILVETVGPLLFVRYLDLTQIGLDVDSSVGTASRTTFTMTVPVMDSWDVRVRFDANVLVTTPGGATFGANVYITTPDLPDISGAAGVPPLSTFLVDHANGAASALLSLWASADGQITARAFSSSITLRIQTLGYFWPGV